MQTRLSLDHGSIQTAPSRDSSLEELLQNPNSLLLSRKLSSASGEARIPLPESRGSSVTQNSQLPPNANDKSPITDNTAEYGQYDRLPAAGNNHNVRFETENIARHGYRRYAATVEDDVSGPFSNEYKRQGHNFPPRYGSSTRRDSLPGTPLRSNTLPTELPSQSTKSAIPDFLTQTRRMTMANPSTPASTSYPTKTRPNSKSVSQFRRMARSKDTLGEEERRDKEGTHVPSEEPANASFTRHKLPPHDRGKETTISDIQEAQASTNLIRLVSPLGFHADLPDPHTENTVPNSPAKEASGHIAFVHRRPTGDRDDTTFPRERHTISQPLLIARGISKWKRRVERRRRQQLTVIIPPPTSPLTPSVHELLREYSEMVKSLAVHMPQLVNVCARDCRVPNSGDIYCYDRFRVEYGFSRIHRRFDHISFPERVFNTPKLLQRIRNLKTEDMDLVRFRYILVEDLSPRVIDHFGATFWLNPEVFEEHLNRSGYRPESYIDPKPSSWNTNGSPKDYASVRWFRPVRRARIKPLSEVDRDVLLGSNGGSGILGLEDRRKNRSVRLATNIFRKEWPMVSDPEETVATEGGASTFRAAWEEKITVQVSRVGEDAAIFLILLDPLPTLDYMDDTYSKSRINKNKVEKVVPFVQAYSRALTGGNFGLVDIFNGQKLDEEAIAKVGEHLCNTNSTLKDITSCLENNIEKPEISGIMGLLWIIHRDVTGFLHFVSDVLEEIGVSATDDYIIQKRLAHWQSLIAQFQTELPAMRLSIESFFNFLSKYQTDLALAEWFIPSTLKLIDELILQNEKSYAALRADMSLLESKRAIDQAESVGKLTELGFFFIPISCVAALFSMQVRPLSKPVPLYSFVVASALTIGLIFSVRLGIRSTVLVDYKRETSRKIRQKTHLSPGSPIPSRIFISYMIQDRNFYGTVVKPLWKVIGSIALGLVVLVAFMLPVILLWVQNRNLDVGFKGALTTVFVVFCAAIVYPLTKNVLHPWLLDTPDLDYRHLRNWMQNMNPARGLRGHFGQEGSSVASSNNDPSPDSGKGKRMFLKDFAKRILSIRKRDAEASLPYTSDPGLESSRRNTSTRVLPLIIESPEVSSPNNLVHQWQNDVEAAQNVETIEEAAHEDEFIAEAAQRDEVFEEVACENEAIEEYSLQLRRIPTNESLEVPAGESSGFSNALVLYSNTS